MRVWTTFDLAWNENRNKTKTPHIASHQHYQNLPRIHLHNIMVQLYIKNCCPWCCLHLIQTHSTVKVTYIISRGCAASVLYDERYERIMSCFGETKHKGRALCVQPHQRVCEEHSPFSLNWARDGYSRASPRAFSSQLAPPIHPWTSDVKMVVFFLCPMVAWHVETIPNRFPALKTGSTLE